MAIVLDVLVAGLVAGGVAGGVVLSARPRGSRPDERAPGRGGADGRLSGVPAAGTASARSGAAASANGGSAHAAADRIGEKEPALAGGTEATMSSGGREAGQTATAPGVVGDSKLTAARPVPAHGDVASALGGAPSADGSVSVAGPSSAAAPGVSAAPQPSAPAGAPAAVPAVPAVPAGAPPAGPADALAVAAAATPSAAATPPPAAPANPAAARPAAPPDAASRAAAREEIADELRERRSEIARIEERLLTKEEALQVKLDDAVRKERSLQDRARNLENEHEKLKQAKREHIRELERIASLSASQARQILLRELEDELRSDSARLVRQVEEEARREADRRARSILATCMQRLAGGHAVETTVSTVALASDDLKGRVIGREGRNIRALEMLTGIDFIVDDTPGAVILSGFDGVRREIARLTLEKLLQDGRIHPARIEEAYYAARSEIENRIMEVGEQAVLEANVGTLHPELTKLLGRLHYRTSYGQNVLAHSIECSTLASMLAAELGASTRTAARAALLHDIGKAVTHEIEGPHALVGGELARRHKESEAVAHAMEAHHNEVPLQTIEAVIVQIADSLSGARPGARGESLENYTKRLRELEEIAKR
ncbi:MAG: ribonucrease, partial [Solirubrobacteraceae bacterium]|nr:ribonucrease [Solirubrobacteraceae bacterium]